LNNRIFNIISIVLILVWIWADRSFRFGSAAYGFILLLYVVVIFCGSYFIQWGFFLKSICSIQTNTKSVALTFDDGPSGEMTSRILDILKEHNAEAAFFCIGKKLSGHEELLKRIVHDGHVIANHSYSHHRFFDLFSARKMLTDLQQMSHVCLDITGFSPRFFRPPYGVTNPNLKKAVLKGGFISVGWSIRSFDTVIKNEERLFNKIMSALKPGSILLLHDTSEATVSILPRLLKTMREREWRVIRLDKMINLNPYD
jgi:peptidoglycan/xylan/chitin deacetylase (PgdA/CDA1 family)